jgi:hypothetical protein
MMAYTKELLGFRELHPEELSAVAGGFSSPPGVGGGGLGGINFSLSPDRSILSISGSANIDGETFKGEFDFTTQDPALQSVDFNLIDGNQTYGVTINVQNYSIGESFTQNFGNEGSVKITLV